MGTHKKELLQKAKKAASHSDANKGKKIRDSIEAVQAVLAVETPNIVDLLDEDGIDLVDLRVYRKKDYTILGLIKLDIGGEYYVAFASGEDYYECLVNLDRRVGERGLSKEKPWSGKATQ